ncbi:hypothetical protein ZTR_08837 [Talaromyces verruculosus]|nr:hypothetical protein ZTR_08837 [Talaromyces verruculosus]
MISTIQELIDPDFDPVMEDVDMDDACQFLKAIPSHIAPDDVEYLRSKNALTVPEPPLLNELLRAYFQWSYNFMPVLNIQDFLPAIVNNDPDANISLFLLQAVMFAGSAFANIDHLRAAGFQTRREARNEFFTRARLLYHLEYEDDPICLLQASLLLTYNNERDNSMQNDMWFWVGLCNTQAQSMGLHRDASNLDMDPAKQRLRRRLWWCLFARDRMVALALRQPTQVNEATSDVSTLRLADFDIESMDSTVSATIGCKYMRDISHQRRLALMFIEKVNLCRCLGLILSAQYSPASIPSNGSSNKTTITLVPRQLSDAELERCSRKLDTWVRNLPREIDIDVPLSREGRDTGERILLIHSSMLRMIYYATCSALYQPRAFAQGREQQSPTLTADKLTDTVRQRLHTAASKTADILHRINRLDLARFLPAAGLTAIRPAAIVHLVNITSTNHVIRDKSAWSFRQCLQLLGQLKDMYPAAEYEAACINHAVRIQYGKMGHAYSLIQHIQLGTDNLDDLDKILLQMSSSQGNSRRRPAGSVISSDSPNPNSGASSADKQSSGYTEDINWTTVGVRQEDSLDRTKDLMFEEWLIQYDKGLDTRSSTQPEPLNDVDFGSTNSKSYPDEEKRDSLDQTPKNANLEFHRQNHSNGRSTSPITLLPPAEENSYTDGTFMMTGDLEEDLRLYGDTSI